MAALCVELHMSPAEYWKLRADEFDALVNELKIRQQKLKAAQRG